MQEIRFHGRGGQGVVSAAQLLVQVVVERGSFAHFIPFFGVERKGSPVYGFMRLDDKDIRLKTQVYEPNCVVIMDDTLIKQVPIFSGLRDDGIVIINTVRSIFDLELPPTVKKVGIVDATGIALETAGVPIPNTAMLGAFAKVTGWVDFEHLNIKIADAFGFANAKAADCAYQTAKVYELQEGGCYE